MDSTFCLLLPQNPHIGKGPEEGSSKERKQMAQKMSEIYLPSLLTRGMRITTTAPKYTSQIKLGELQSGLSPCQGGYGEQHLQHEGRKWKLISSLEGALNNIYQNTNCSLL